MTEPSNDPDSRTRDLTRGSDLDDALPLRRMITRLERDDLILAPRTLAEIDAIASRLARSRAPSLRCLFHGPSGTGKTLSATLLGKSVGADVYGLELSAIRSKYVGETEKNLADLFERAQRGRWLLLFDEADALFGKRTGTADSHDRYANVEVSYLLRRIEEYSGVIILTTDLKSDVDPALVRRCEHVVHFPVPDAVLRLGLWHAATDERYRLASDVDLREIAEHHELSGGAIAAAVRHAASRAGRCGSEIRRVDLLEGVERESRRRTDARSR